MKRIVLISFISSVLLACQPLAPRITPNTVTPEKETLNTPTSSVDETITDVISSFSSPDIVFVGGPNLDVYVMGQNGSNVTQLTESGSIYPPAKWSPDKKQIAFQVIVDQSHTSIFIMNPDGSDQHSLNPNFQELGPVEFQWSPNGEQIAVMGGLGFHIINISNGEFTSYEDPGIPRHMAWSADGSKIALAMEGSILIVDVHKNESYQTIDLDYGYINETAWSPDGERIAFSAIDMPACKGTGSYCYGIFVVNSSGSGVVQLTDKTDNSYKVRGWTADGRHILFDGIDKERDPYVALIEIDNSKIQVINESGSSSLLSKDNQQIIYSTDKGNGICITDLDKKEETCLPEEIISSLQILSFDW